jgi:hypothetical protein
MRPAGVNTPTRILMVGDHAPPSWTRRGRSHFAKGKVRWILLEPRQASPLDRASHQGGRTGPASSGGAERRRRHQRKAA